MQATLLVMSYCTGNANFGKVGLPTITTMACRAGMNTLGPSLYALYITLGVHASVCLHVNACLCECIRTCCTTLLPWHDMV